MHSNCRKCGLYLHSGNHCRIAGRGNKIDPKVIMIGEAPGPDEVKKNMIFTGKAGKKLDEMIKQYDGTYYLTNMVKCHPPDETGQKNFRTPTALEVEYCKPLLIQELHSFIHNIPIIVPLGNIALTGLVGENKGITKELGKLRKVKIGFKEYLVIPNYHPSYICRNPEFEAIFRETLRKVYDNC
jgi:DNA polymerase